MVCNFLAYFQVSENRTKIANKLADYQGNTFPYIEPDDIINRLSPSNSKVPKRFRQNFDIEKWIWACCLKLLRQYRADYYHNRFRSGALIPIYGLAYPGDRDEDAIDRTYVTKAVEKLPPLERDIIFSHTYNEESYRSIGRRHGLPHYTIIKYHHAALRKLKTLLENENQLKKEDIHNL